MSTPEPTIIHYLAMNDPKALRAKAAPLGFKTTMVDPPDIEVNRRFYELVGKEWKWTDRLSWSNEQWREYVDRDALETWIGTVHGQEVGYFELELEENGDLQIAYFGLLPKFIGQGLGGALLTAAVERAWSIHGVCRVWLHTCTNDHHHALQNYRSRGFEVFMTNRV